jgi:hypothetical protein
MLAVALTFEPPGEAAATAKVLSIAAAVLGAIAPPASRPRLARSALPRR